MLIQPISVSFYRFSVSSLSKNIARLFLDPAATSRMAFAIYFVLGVSGFAHAQSQIVQRVPEAKHGKSRPLYALLQNRPLARATNQAAETENRVRLLPVPTKTKAIPGIALAV